MLSLSQARTLCLEAALPLGVVEAPLAEALGRFLAEPLVANRAMPGCDNSAMDGFAVRAAETAGATPETPRSFRLAGVLYAGMPVPDRALAPGETFRIFTGAPVPPGADAVVRQESAREEASRALIFAPVAPGEAVRRRGEEFQEGQALLPAGSRIDAATLAVLASLGRATATVRARPRVGVLTLGDELVVVGQPAAAHQVYESNSALIQALATEAGAQVSAVGRARDLDEEIRAELERLARESDLVVTCGGASVGAKDLCKQALRAMGASFAFDGVAVKPGKPAGLARLGRVPVAVLPGNPGAAMVGFDQFVRPLLLAQQGVVEERRRVRARLDAARSKAPALAYLYGARIAQRGPDTWVDTRARGSGQLFQNVGIEGWAILPEGATELPEGAEIDVELFGGSRFALLEAAVFS